MHDRRPTTTCVNVHAHTSTMRRERGPVGKRRTVPDRSTGRCTFRNRHLTARTNTPEAFRQSVPRPSFPFPFPRPACTQGGTARADSRTRTLPALSPIGADRLASPASARRTPKYPRIFRLLARTPAHARTYVACLLVTTPPGLRPARLLARIASLVRPADGHPRRIQGSGYRIPRPIAHRLS
ncbi:hypothetical protein OH77DRAFT_540390 [Trametes cingulata]|nr:hypothetical protein OH77DRAFT_540390 [Trametes cingulata]